MLSIIIPSNKEKFLQRTIDDLLEKAEGEVQIIAVLDGYWPDPALKPDNRVTILHFGESKGLRNAITSGVAVAEGEHIMKIDAHCMVDKGFDVKLIADCQKDWIITPRRKRLDADTWTITDQSKPDVDYMYLSYPEDEGDFGGAGMNGKNWDEKNKDKSLKDIFIDDIPAAQGSSWFMHKDYFYELELMDEESYGSFWGESQELAFKCVLSGGRYVVDKNTWYAHLHKGKKHGRGYFLDKRLLVKGRDQTMRYFTGKKVWHKQKYPLSRLIEMHPNMPGWTEERLAALKEREAQNFYDRK